MVLFYNAISVLGIKFYFDLYFFSKLQEVYTEGDKIGNLQCDVRHKFHFSCIKSWLMQRYNCPICRMTALNLLHYYMLFLQHSSIHSSYIIQKLFFYVNLFFNVEKQSSKESNKEH